MAVSQFNSFALISMFVVVSLATFCFSQANGYGFSVDVFHRDSQDSPFYNPLETRSERFSAAFRRSINRAQRFNSASSSVLRNSAQATVTSNSGNYFMNMSLGSPPFPISAILDTGSDLTWTQCEPCKQCYKQTDPLFDPRKSTTYREVSCKSAKCRRNGGNSCNGSSSACNYSITYGDDSYTKGVIGLDTVTLSSTSSRPVALHKTIIGCGFHNQGTFPKEGSGIVGLGRGPDSLVSRMGSSIDGKFSYCLVPLSSEKSKTSKLHFGDRAVVTGETAVSTPLFKGDPPNWFTAWYILKLEAISVGRKRLDLNETWKPFGSSDGNIIIDSGTTITILPPILYAEFESAVAEQIDLKRVEDPEKDLTLCYESQSDDIKIPKITIHFHRADIELTVMNTFSRISKNIVCFAFAPYKYIATYGNIAQMNFLVGYDSVKKTVTFKPTDCTKTN